MRTRGMGDMLIHGMCDTCMYGVGIQFCGICMFMCGLRAVHLLICCVYETWTREWIYARAGICVRGMHVCTCIYVGCEWGCYIYEHARDSDVC